MYGLLTGTSAPPELKSQTTICIPKRGKTHDSPPSLTSTSRLQYPTSFFFTPIPGHDTVTVPSLSFLIEHPPTNRKLLFDLGTRKDTENLPPRIQTLFQHPNVKANVTHNVADILNQSGLVSPADIEAVILSHHHFDHAGDMTTFPLSTEIVVGPGFKDAYIPGWPTRADSTLIEADWEGRNAKEVSFRGTNLRIGGFDALDYFGDGSFYLLDSPGHTVGHINALARVTAGKANGYGGQEDDTFVLMGGDTCHFTGQLRPTPHRPLPEQITPSPLPKRYPGFCPGAVFDSLLPGARDEGGGGCNAREQRPFYDIAAEASVDLEASNESLQKLRNFDAADNVLILIGHDEAVVNDGIDLFPEKINSWKKKGYGENIRWKFLEALEEIDKFK